MSDGTRVVGLISGTSIDGIDVAAADLRVVDDHRLELRPLGYLDIAYPEPLRGQLQQALPPHPSTAEALTKLDTRIGQTFAEAALAGLDELAGGAADVIASLGQTIFHWVEGTQALGTMQLGAPAWIAERTGLPVVADLRVRDVAAGGHGAPLASTLDALWLRGLPESAGRRYAALNIGGIANITVIAPDANVLAYDTGPGNALLDAATYDVTAGAQQFDRGGELAQKGQVRTDLLNVLLADAYYAKPPPKSTGREYFHIGYLRQVLADLPTVSAEDLLATLTELTAITIAKACASHAVHTVVASGGGIDNPALVTALTRQLGDIHLRTSDELGLPHTAKEAYLTALLGWLTWHGLPANIASATGARGERLLGSITPGSGPLTLPEPRSTPVTSLYVVPSSQ